MSQPPRLDGEIWKPIDDCPGYWISSLGRAWSNRRKSTVLKIRNDLTGGYAYIRPTKTDGRQKTMKIHLLVAAAFLGPRPPGLDALHNDGDNANNAASNLRYGTRSENELDKVAHGTHQNARKTHCKRNHEFTPENTGTQRSGRFCRTCVRIKKKERANE